MSSPLLSIEGISLRVDGRCLLEHLDLSIDPGHFIAIAGPSGSGKTSLMRTIAGQLKPAKGMVINHLESPSKLAMIFQDLQLADGATSLINVLGGSLGRHSFFSTFFGFPKEELESARKLLVKFGLKDKERQWASTLSRGERQRVAACRTLLTRPTLLLADEPVSSLDPSTADLVLTNLKESIIGRNGSILCSLHSDEQVRKFADIVIYLDPSDPNAWKVDTLDKKTQK